MISERIFSTVECKLRTIKEQIEKGSVKVVKKVDYDTCDGGRGPYSACCIVELVATDGIVATIHLEECYNPFLSSISGSYSYNNFVEIAEQSQTQTLPPQIQKFDFDHKTLWVNALIVRITDIVSQWDNMRCQCSRNR